MRRPLDWVVVSISLMVLFANRLLTDSDPVPVAAVPDFEAAVPPESPFAYIREDGSQIFLPAAGSRLAAPARLQPASTTHAVYTWTLPMATSAGDKASFQ